jgi:hypothetical protein
MINSAKTSELTSDELDRVSGGIIIAVVIVKSQPARLLINGRYHRSGIG